VRRPCRAVTSLLVGVCALALLGGAPAAASTPPAYDAPVDLTFPVEGSSSFIDDYHHCRGTDCSRRHRATDIMAPYGAPVHAAVGGTIRFITGLTSPLPSYGWMISIDGDDGRGYNYIHLGRQDRGWEEAYAPGMERGVRVERGQLIGFNGCSGNASCSAPHLHFEIEDTRVTDPYGTNRMNPYASLVAARDRGDVPSRATEARVGRAYALVGDWDADGRDQLGWWQDAQVRLQRTDGSVTSFRYGRAGDVPVVADWNGDGRDTISVIRDGTWHLNDALLGGHSSRTFIYGRVAKGDLPITGTWKGKGPSLPGIIRDTDWHLRFEQSGGRADLSFRYGRLSDGDLPLIGDWNADGRTTVGIVRNGEWHLLDDLAAGHAKSPYVYGRVRTGDVPVVGDWTGDGRATPGIVRDGVWHLKNEHGAGVADRAVPFPAP
jgi:murein DD-endopeptidase MepM/ murein hydrolase activator NlpD